MWVAISIGFTQQKMVFIERFFGWVVTNIFLYIPKSCLKLEEQWQFYTNWTHGVIGWVTCLNLYGEMFADHNELFS